MSTRCRRWRATASSRRWKKRSLLRDRTEEGELRGSSAQKSVRVVVELDGDDVRHRQVLTLASRYIEHPVLDRAARGGAIQAAVPARTVQVGALRAAVLVDGYVHVHRAFLSANLRAQRKGSRFL